MHFNLINSFQRDVDNAKLHTRDWGNKIAIRPVPASFFGAILRFVLASFIYFHTIEIDTILPCSALFNCFAMII